MMENEIKTLVEKYSNDSDLGKAVRKLVNEVYDNSECFYEEVSYHEAISKK